MRLHTAMTASLWYNIEMKKLKSWETEQLVTIIQQDMMETLSAGSKSLTLW